MDKVGCFGFVLFSVFTVQALKRHNSFWLTFHWLELSHIATHIYVSREDELKEQSQHLQKHSFH